MIILFKTDKKRISFIVKSKKLKKNLISHKLNLNFQSWPRWRRKMGRGLREDHSDHKRNRRVRRHPCPAHVGRLRSHFRSEVSGKSHRNRDHSGFRRRRRPLSRPQRRDPCHRSLGHWTSWIGCFVPRGTPSQRSLHHGSFGIWIRWSPGRRDDGLCAESVANDVCRYVWTCPAVRHVITFGVCSKQSHRPHPHTS